MRNFLSSTSYLSSLLSIFLLLLSVGNDATAEHKLSRSVSPAQAEQRSGEWLAHGRTYSEQRYSPLHQITAKNVSQLGLAWSYDLGVSRGIEASPLVIDGVLYLTSTWNKVYALNAKTGELIWQYDPKVDKSRARYLCCDAVNRGLAAWGKNLYMGTIDGRLIAMDARTGAVQWDVLTIDKDRSYTITGAPRVVNGRVLIGSGGAEYGVRGYISAYHHKTGKMLWRFHTVPGNPKDGFENEAMAKAAKTWSGEWWKYGGGGTVWDSMAYDPELNLLYIGVGNGSPWNQAIRSPEGGDNLYLSSIVALRPDTGEYVWHYQTTPGETWDYTATQHIVLAEIEHQGKPRKVLMQAPKNGFFYVIDRKTGELLSAENYVPTTWASKIDLKTGRPVENPGVRWGAGGAPVFTMPGPFGGHNWHPMSFSPQTGLMYIPAMEVPFVYGRDGKFSFDKDVWNTGADMTLASFPTDKEQLKGFMNMIKGRLLAWDPVAQKAVWEKEHKGPWNGGVLSTAGGLVFQGNGDGQVVAYDAADGSSLWSFFAQTGVVAPPITYSIDGEQYIAVAAGWGGALTLAYGGVIQIDHQTPTGRLLVFKLGGKATLAPVPRVEKRDDAVPPALTVEPAVIASGKTLYINNCLTCHGDHAQSSGLVPNLRETPILGIPLAWKAVVLDGVLSSSGMPKFADQLSETDLEAIRAYVIFEARSGRDGKFYRSVAPSH